MKPLNLFDFDNTLALCDSFIPFLIFSCGAKKVLRALLFLLKSRLSRRLSRGEAKEILLAKTIAGMRPEELDIERFAELLLSTAINQELLEELQNRSEQRRIIISASPELYLSAIASRLGVELIGTRLELDSQGRIVGKLKGENCRAAEKVRRLREILNPSDYSPIRAYGDSEGDAEMLLIADEQHYREGRPLGHSLRKLIAVFQLYRACLSSVTPFKVNSP